MDGERKPSRRVLAAVFTLVLAFALIGVVAASGPAPSVTPANPSFVSYIQNLPSGRTQEITEDGHTLGLLPPPIKLPRIKPKATAQTMALVGLPTSYDLRTKDKLTGVRDQQTCGACWAFATYGSLESSLRPLETWDFSENNMKNTSGFDLNPCDGGNQYIAAAYLARWSGPATEMDDPYNPDSTTSPPAPVIQKHLQEVDFLPDRAGPTDNDAIKRAVMTYGAVYTSMYWGGGSYNAGTYAYYYSGTAAVNHAVCIVGWDDNFDRTRFLTTPPENGAFLIKNSWGPAWGDGGYFWISYYDSKVGTENALFQFAEPTINYDHIYQYDPLGWVRSAGYSTETAWFANVFHAGSEEDLNAISFYTPVPNSAYWICVYLNPTLGPINPSGPVLTLTGTITDPGYHTIQLDPSVTLHTDDTFSVVVRLNTPGYTYPIPMETPLSGYSGRATANASESFISADSTEWEDASSVLANANVCLKAFTADRAALLVSPATSLNTTGPAGGPFSTTSQTYTLTNVGNTDLDWSAVKNQSWVDLSAASGRLEPGGYTTVTVSLNPAITGFDPGAYNDTVQFINETSGVGSTSRTVSLHIQDGCLTVTPSAGVSSLGSPGGPFEPSSFVFTLANTGYGRITWAANKAQSWTTLSQEGGYLSPGERVDVVVSINPNAENLPTGEYADTVLFTNITNGDGDTARGVHLSVIRNYAVSQTAFTWIDPSNHASLILSDDGVTTAQTIPFSFGFYGTIYNQVYVGANGLLGFASSGLSDYENVDIPSRTLPNAAIYPYWDDLDPSAGGHVHVGTEGTAPYRKMVITWDSVAPYLSGFPLTFQAILCETTGDIILQYKEVQPDDSVNGAGRSATIGVEDADGSVACRYSFNGSTPISNGQAIVFSVNGDVSISEAMRMANGIGCTIRNVAVTAVPSSSLFYVESLDRSRGISVYKSGHGVLPGDKVDIQGTIPTNASGERFISGTSITPSGEQTIIKPLLVSNMRIGGADWYYDSVTKAGQQGIAGAIGLNNIGLLVTTAGRVTYSNTTYFYIDDGSNLRDNSGHVGVKVLGTVPVAPGEDPVGKYVIVTGISSCFKGDLPDTNLYRLVRSTDVRIVE